MISPDQLQDDLIQAQKSHGGLSNWNKIESITLEEAQVNGFVLRIKGLGITFHVPKKVMVFPKKLRAEFPDYPKKGKMCVYENGTVSVFISGTGEKIFEKNHYRSRFSGFKKNRFWSTSDAAYFLGYSVVNYLCLPFILTGPAKCIASRRSSPSNNEFQITAEFPSNFDTHCKVQKFTFNKNGLLYRHDYNANILGWWANGAHLSYDYRILNGLPISTRRRVYPVYFGIRIPIAVIKVRYQPVEIRYR